MKKGRFTDEQIVAIVRESRAHGVPATAKKHQVSEQTLYTWRRRFGDMEVSHVAELKRALAENAKLKKLLAERDLEIDVMKEVVAKNGRRTSQNSGSSVRRRTRNRPASCLRPVRSRPFHDHLPPPPAGEGQAHGRSHCRSVAREHVVGSPDDPWLATRKGAS